MSLELKNIILNLIALTMLGLAISSLLLGNYWEMAAYIVTAVFLTPVIPTPIWLDMVAFVASIAACGYLMGSGS